jgi:hypothetical protein
MKSDRWLLFIEPEQPASALPVIDDPTLRITAAFRRATPDRLIYCGVHQCKCGATSHRRNYHLPNGETTHSLCIHYMAHHRAEVPQQQMAKVLLLANGDLQPTDEELQGPDWLAAKWQSDLERDLGPERAQFWISLGLDTRALGKAAALWHLQEWKRADHLSSILSGIPIEALADFRDHVQRRFGDPRQWAESALNGYRWQREEWEPLLIDMLQSGTSEARAWAGEVLKVSFRPRSDILRNYGTDG